MIINSNLYDIDKELCVFSMFQYICTFRSMLNHFVFFSFFLILNMCIARSMNNNFGRVKIVKFPIDFNSKMFFEIS